MVESLADLQICMRSWWFYYDYGNRSLWKVCSTFVAKKSLNVHTVEGGSQNEAACSAAQGKSISVQTDPTLWFVKYLIGTVLSAVTLDLVQMLYL